MADEDPDKMEAALALMGMGSSLIQPVSTSAPSNPVQGSSRKSRGHSGSKNRKAAKTTSDQSEHTVPSSHKMDPSANGFKPPPVAHVPVPSIPHPRIGIAEAKVPAKSQMDTPVSRKGVLPKVSKNILLRSKLESRIQAKEAAAQEMANAQIKPEASRDIQASEGKPVPAKRRKKNATKTGADGKQQQNFESTSALNTDKKTSPPSTMIQRQSVAQTKPVTYTLNAIHKYIDPNEVKKPGEFSSNAMVAKSAVGNISSASAQSISPAIYLGNGQQRIVSNSEPHSVVSQPKIELASLSTMQRAPSSTVMLPTVFSSTVATSYMPTHMSGNVPVLGHSLTPHGLGKSRDKAMGEKPVLKLAIPSKITAASKTTPLPPVSYSPISPADSLTVGPRYATISPPTTVSAADQSEPLDLSKETAMSKVNISVKQAVPRMPVETKIRTHLMPLVGKPLASPLPIFNEDKFKLLMKDGKLTCVHKDSGATQVIENPSAIGIQVVTDPKTGQTLFIPNPKIQELERQESKSPVVSRQNSQVSVENQEREYRVKSPGEMSTDSKSPEPISPPKTVRSQSTLPPKKRKFVEQSEETPSTPTVVSPKSLSSVASSFSDEGYGTLSENIMIPTAVNVTNTSALSTSVAKTTPVASNLNKPVMIAYPLLTSPYTAISLAQVRLIQSSSNVSKPVIPSAGILSGSRPVFFSTETMKPIPLANPLPQITPLKPATVAHSLPANLDQIASSPAVPKTTANDATVHDLYAHKLFEEYKRSLEEASFVKPGKSPFQHFRPSKVRTSATKASVDLTTSSSWSSKIATQPQSGSFPAIPMKTEPVPTTSQTIIKRSSSNDYSGGPLAVKEMMIKREEQVPKLFKGEEKSVGMTETAVPTIEPPVTIEQKNTAQEDRTNTLPNQKDEGVEMETEEEDPEEGGGDTEDVGPMEEEISEELREGCKRAGIADDDGDLPIHIAVVHENLEAVEKLIYMMQIADITIDHCNNDRQTPLHLAVITQNAAILSCLLQAGSNPNIADRKGCTGIHLAVKHNSKDNLIAILKESQIQPDLNAKNYEGYTALHMAVLHRHPEFVQVLLLAGANKDLQDNKSGRTALFHAAETKQFSIASTLLQKGASVNIPSYAGTSPAQAANGRGHSDLVALLIKYGADVSSSLRETESPKILYPPIKSASSTVKSAVKESLKSRRRLQRMASSSDMSPSKPSSRMRKGQPEQAQSLDFDLDLSSNSLANRRRGAPSIQHMASQFFPKKPDNPLRIVLPDQGGVAASMPLSPSALGLATRKTLPMIPPMQAKSLPEDVAITPDSPVQTNDAIPSEHTKKKDPDKPTSSNVSPVRKSPVDLHKVVSPFKISHPHPNEAMQNIQVKHETRNEAMQMKNRNEAINLSPTTRRVQQSGLKRTSSESSLQKTSCGFVLPSKLPPLSTNSSFVKAITVDPLGKPINLSAQTTKSDDKQTSKVPYVRQSSDESIRNETKEPKRLKLDSSAMSAMEKELPQNDGILTLKLKLSDKAVPQPDAANSMVQSRNDVQVQSPQLKPPEKRSPTQVNEQEPKPTRSPTYGSKYMNSLKAVSKQEPKMTTINKQTVRSGSLKVPSSLPLNTNEIRRTASLKVPSSLPLTKKTDRGLTSPIITSPSTPLTPDMTIAKSPTVIKKLALCPKTGDLIAQEIAPGGTDPELEKVAIPLGPEVAMQKALMSPGSFPPFPSPFYPSPVQSTAMKLPSPAEVRTIAEKVISNASQDNAAKSVPGRRSPSQSPTSVKKPDILANIPQSGKLMKPPFEKRPSYSAKNRLSGEYALTVKESNKGTVAGVVSTITKEKNTGTETSTSLGTKSSTNVRNTPDKSDSVASLPSASVTCSSVSSTKSPEEDAKSIDSDGSVELSISICEEMEMEHNQQPEQKPEDTQKLHKQTENTMAMMSEEQNRNQTKQRKQEQNSEIVKVKTGERDTKSKGSEMVSPENKPIGDAYNSDRAISKSTSVSSEDSVSQEMTSVLQQTTIATNATNSKEVARSNIRDNQEVNQGSGGQTSLSSQRDKDNTGESQLSESYSSDRKAGRTEDVEKEEHTHRPTENRVVSASERNSNSEESSKTKSDLNMQPSTTNQTTKQRLLTVLKAREKKPPMLTALALVTASAKLKQTKVDPVNRIQDETASGLRKSISDHDLAIHFRKYQTQESVSDSELEKKEPADERNVNSSTSAKNIFDIFKAESKDGCSSS